MIHPDGLPIVSTATLYSILFENPLCLCRSLSSIGNLRVFCGRGVLGRDQQDLQEATITDSGSILFILFILSKISLLPESSDLFLRHEPCEVLEGPVIRPFCIPRETAGGQFSVLGVVLDAFTTDSLSRAGLVAAIAPLEVLFFLAFHADIPLAWIIHKS